MGSPQCNGDVAAATTSDSNRRHGPLPRTPVVSPDASVHHGRYDRQSATATYRLQWSIH